MLQAKGDLTEEVKSKNLELIPFEMNPGKLKNLKKIMKVKWNILLFLKGLFTWFKSYLINYKRNEAQIYSKNWKTVLENMKND